MARPVILSSPETTVFQSAKWNLAFLLKKKTGEAYNGIAGLAIQVKAKDTFAPQRRKIILCISYYGFSPWPLCTLW